MASRRSVDRSTGRRVCVIGAGIGSLIAISLGELGLEVTLVDERPRILGGASDSQLARLHLGQHYSGDSRFARDRLNTAQRCTLGALAWLRRYPEMAPTEGRWWQLITANSMTSPEDYLRFCGALADYHAELARDDRLARRVLTGSAPTFRPLDAAEYADHLVRDRVALAVETVERVIDIGELRRSVTRDLVASPGVAVVLSTRVLGIRRGPGGGYVVDLADGERLEVDVVVNASWHDLASLADEGRTHDPMTTRLRFVADAELPESLRGVPSMFFHRGVLGNHTRLDDRSMRFVSEPVCNFAAMPGVGVPEAWRRLVVRPHDPACWVDGIRSALTLPNAGRAEASSSTSLDHLRDELACIVRSDGTATGAHVHDHIAAAIVDGYAEFVPAVRECRDVRVTPTVSVDLGRTEIWKASGSVHHRDWAIHGDDRGLFTVNPGKFTFGVLVADEAVTRVMALVGEDAGSVDEIVIAERLNVR